MTDETQYQCACCGIPFIEGKGFVEPHKPPCANDRYGWNYTVAAGAQAEFFGHFDPKPVAESLQNALRGLLNRS